MSNYQRAIFGIANASPNNVPAAVVREQARIAADGPLNKKLRYFGYGRLVPQADIEPADQVLTKNNDNEGVMKLWWQKCNADPQMIWVGVFDNQTKQLIWSSNGQGIVRDVNIGPVTVTPTKTPAKSSRGPSGGMVAAIGAAVVGMIVIAKRKG